MSIELNTNLSQLFHAMEVKFDDFVGTLACVIAAIVAEPTERHFSELTNNHSVVRDVEALKHDVKGIKNTLHI